MHASQGGFNHGQRTLRRELRLTLSPSLTGRDFQAQCVPRFVLVEATPAATAHGDGLRESDREGLERLRGAASHASLRGYLVCEQVVRRPPALPRRCRDRRRTVQRIMRMA